MSMPTFPVSTAGLMSMKNYCEYSYHADGKLSRLGWANQNLYFFSHISSVGVHFNSII